MPEDPKLPRLFGATRLRLVSRIEVALVWLLAHGATMWPFVVFAGVLALSWGELRQIHPGQVRAAVRNLDSRWLVIAAATTGASVAIMGLYDVVAFRHTRCRWQERWRNGAVAFAWSNFLTLGPLAGPAVRLWLYRGDVDDLSELHAGIASIAIAFMSGLIGWALATLIAAWVPAFAQSGGAGFAALGALSFALVLLAASVARGVANRVKTLTRPEAGLPRALELAIIGWLDWLLAAGVFVACFHAAASDRSVISQVEAFFLGQAIGLASMVPGGVGSSDAFWIARLPVSKSAAAAVLLAYRMMYYVVPWALASLVLLARATRHVPRRLEIARRMVAGLVGGGGVLIILSSASPAVHARLLLLERVVPLQLVEVGHVTAALAGLVLVVLARGLSRGYRAAFRATLILLTLASVAAILKGFDWEEALVLAAIAVAARSQSALFDRPSRGDWIEGPDLALAFGALTLFLSFGTLSHHLGARSLERWSHIGYRLEGTRFVRTAASMALAVAAGTMYVVLRAPSRFTRLEEPDIALTLQRHAEIGRGTNALMVATGDKAVLSTAQGFCLYRAIGPYLVVFSDPSVKGADRPAFLDELSAAALDLDRRPVFYQVSLDWIPVLHDRGYHFFKLGEEAHVHLDRVTLEGHAGKMYRQVLRRAERDGMTCRVLQPAEVQPRMAELADISTEWLRAKKLVERQFSMGFFDPAYLGRFPCAVVESGGPQGRLLAFANLLEGPRREELSVDLMRQRNGGPQVMDFLIVSLLLEGKRAGYRMFNLGMAPLASVGTQRGAHMRERLARLLFQRGEHWYNFQGLRFYKDKYNPEWMPRYLAYQNAWEWPVVIAHASALIAGGWTRILLPPRDGSRTPAPSGAGHSPPPSSNDLGGDVPDVNPAPP